MLLGLFKHQPQSPTTYSTAGSVVATGVLARRGTAPVSRRGAGATWVGFGRERPARNTFARHLCCAIVRLTNDDTIQLDLPESPSVGTGNAQPQFCCTGCRRECFLGRFPSVSTFEKQLFLGPLLVHVELSKDFLIGCTATVTPVCG